MADVFVSYKAEDRRRVQPLVEAIEADGLSVWWDTHIGGGDDWRDSIQLHLEESKCVIVVWSRRSIGREGHFVRDEATRAQRRGIYLPVRIDKVDPPLGFGETQAVTLNGWKGDRSDPRYEAVITAARAIVSGKPRPSSGRDEQVAISRRAALGTVIAAAAAVSTGAWIWRKAKPTKSKRIAVLPFANLSDNPEQTYFSEGIAEELRSALSRIGLEVMGRSSSNAVKDLDAKEAAAKLGVANILTGSIRRSSDTIRINAQLVSGSDGVQRWAQTYDRAPGDAIKIQTDIAESVAQALRIALGQAGRAALELGGTTDSVAQDLVLQARALYVRANGPEGIEQAVALIDAAIERDPTYAGAYVERANALSIFASSFPGNQDEAARQWAEVAKSAKKAVALAPKFGAARIALASAAQGQLDFTGLLQHTREALQLSPDDPNVLVDAVFFLASLGHGEEALQLADRLVALDRLNPRVYARRAGVLRQLRRYPEALEAVQTARNMGPGNPARTGIAGDSWLILGNLEKAKKEYGTMPADDVSRLTGEAIAAARMGDRNEAERKIARLRQVYGAGTSYQYAEIYAQLGDKDRAFAELENAIAIKDPGLLDLKVDPFLDPIRDDARYVALVTRLRFPS